MLRTTVYLLVLCTALLLCGQCLSAPAQPTITSFTPGAAAICNTVTIRGTNFNGATAVKFSGVDAMSFRIVDDTTITAVVPATTSGKITVKTPGGICASAAVFSFIPFPTITSFTPMATGKGATVTITGANYTGATSVKFNGVAAKFTIVDATTISAVVPITTSGKITIASRGGVCASPSVFTFVPCPSITSFTPMSATTNSTVTITGSNFAGATAVKLGGVAAKSFRVVNATTITAVVPQTTSGKITVTTPGGICASPSVFTFIPGPSITSFTPMAIGTGATVTITGSNFTGATAVKFNGVAAGSFSVVSATTITAVVPQTTSGKVTVTTPGGICASPSAFTFVQAPTITSFSPTSGAIGDPVNITGTNFTGATSVKFNGVAATTFTVVDSTSIAAVVPNTTSGPIAIATPGGTATSATSFTVAANTAASLVAQGKSKVNQCVIMEPFNPTSAKTYMQQAKSCFEQAKVLEANNSAANFGLAITDAALTAQTLMDKYQSTFTSNNAKGLSTLKYTVNALQVLNLGSAVMSGKEPLNGLVSCYADSVKEPLTRGDSPDSQLILDIQTDIKNTIRPMLGRVADYLTIVEANGGASFVFPIGTTNWDGYKKIDMGDVYLFHGLLLAAKWALAIPVSYNVNIGTFNWDTSPLTLDANQDGLLSTSEYLPASPFLNLTDSATMTAAKTDMITAADKIIAGINATLAETADDYDLIAWHTPGAGPTQSDLLNAKSYATSLKASMSAAETISWEGDSGGTKSVRVFLGAWNKTPPTSLKMMMPSQEVSRWYDYGAGEFGYDMIAAEGGFPDATFGGMFPDGMPGINDPVDPVDFNTGFNGTLVGISTTPTNGSSGVSPFDWSGSIGFNGYPPAQFSVSLQRYFAGKWRGELLTYGYNMGSMFFVYPDHMLWPNSSYRMIIKDEVANGTYTTTFTTGPDTLP